MGFLARTAEASERYDDMCKCMKELVAFSSSESPSNKGELSIDERNLLSVAYKNVIGARRASWRTLNAENEDNNGPLVQKYKRVVENELEAVCTDVLNILQENLINDDTIRKCHENVNEPNSSDDKKDPLGEAQVFYLKMAGDYYRYLAEAVSTKENEMSAADFYKKAFELSQKVLEPTHPIRLGLALNYSVCFYEILKNRKKACQLAKDAFDEAISKLDKLEEADYKDSTLIMQLLRDNLTLWTSTAGSEDGDKDEGNNFDEGD